MPTEGVMKGSRSTKRKPSPERTTQALDGKRMERLFLEMIRRASTDLPPDVEQALASAFGGEAEMSSGRNALGILLRNIEMARKEVRPMCQDTGTNTWWIARPRAVREREIVDAVVAATRKATSLGYLRPNSVDSVTGTNSGDNVGLGHPVVHVHEADGEDLTADLLLKGGGCENVSAQVSLPDSAIGAGRDVEGVRRVVLKMINAAQGKGCAPGVLGICIGGDRVTGYELGKRQLLRPLTDSSPDPVLADLERRLLAQANVLDIGPMGFGGKTTLLGVKVTKAHRLPASFFVTMAYSCWSLRRAHARIRNGRVSHSRVPFDAVGG